MADRVGQQLGNYQLIRPLGEGGFAEVYLGEHIHLGTYAAIKVLHTQLASEDTEHFRTEARNLARLVHPNIVRVLEFGIEGKTPFLVMDYALDGTLRQLHPTSGDDGTCQRPEESLRECASVRYSLRAGESGRYTYFRKTSYTYPSGTTTSCSNTPYSSSSIFCHPISASNIACSSLTAGRNDCLYLSWSFRYSESSCVGT
jgi:hypothetical protein